MVKRRPQYIRGMIAAVLSLSLLLGITSCTVLLEELYEAYESNNTGASGVPRDTEETFESFEPTVSYTSDTAETTEISVNFVIFGVCFSKFNFVKLVFE